MEQHIDARDVYSLKVCTFVERIAIIVQIIRQSKFGKRETIIECFATEISNARWSIEVLDLRAVIEGVVGNLCCALRERHGLERKRQETLLYRVTRRAEDPAEPGVRGRCALADEGKSYRLDSVAVPERAALDLRNAARNDDALDRGDVVERLCGDGGYERVVVGGGDHDVALVAVIAGERVIARRGIDLVGVGKRCNAHKDTAGLNTVFEIRGGVDERRVQLLHTDRLALEAVGIPYDLKENGSAVDLDRNRGGEIDVFYVSVVGYLREELELCRDA